jgi:hypothetical protein
MILTPAETSRGRRRISHMAKISKRMRTFLVIAPPVLLLLGAWCFSFLFSFENCERACIPEAHSIAVRVTGGILGLILVAAAGLAVTALLSHGQQERIAKLSGRLTFIGLGFFVPWVIYASWASVSVTT